MIYFTTGDKLGKIGERLKRNGAFPLSLNLVDRSSIESAVKSLKKHDVIIHSASISSIDECEKDYEKALAVNTWGTNVLCETTELYGIKKLVLLSTEQVFDGRWGNYKEGNKPNPVNRYGMSKLGAESIVPLYGYKTLRLSRVLSFKDPDIVDILKNSPSVPVFIRRSYTHVDFTARAIMNYALRYDEMPDILHYGSSKPISYYSLAKMLNPKVTARWFPEKEHSPRPYNCGLNVSLAKKLGLPIQTSQEAISQLFVEVMKNIKESKNK